MDISGPLMERGRSQREAGRRARPSMYVPRVHALADFNRVNRRGGMLHAFAILTEVLRHARQRDHQGSEV